MVETISYNEQKEKEMESRIFSLVFIGPPTSGKSVLTTYVAETLHLPVIYGSRIVNPSDIPSDGSLIPDGVFNESLQKVLNSEPPTGHIFDGIPRTIKQAEIISNWAKEKGFPLHIINLQIDDAEILDRVENREVCPKCKESYHFRAKPSATPGRCDIDGATLEKRLDDNLRILEKRLEAFNLETKEILSFFKSKGNQIHHINSNGLIKDASRRVFTELSPLSFDDPKLAEKYFELQDFVTANDIHLMLISGACGYIYYGRRPLKDLDFLVSSKENLEKIAATTTEKVEFLDSTYALSQYLNFSSGVELVADLSAKYRELDQVKLSPFRFEEMDMEARVVRFLGEPCKIMSPEWLIVFKLCLGRSGADDFGHNKNDFADAYDVTISQPVDWDKVMTIARKIGAEKRVEQGLETLRSSAY